MEHLREITADVFDVAARLREIDARYRLFYNLKAGPPDRRSVEHVRKTRAERAAQLFEQYKKENERLQRAKLKECAERALSAAAGALSGRKNDA